MANEFITRKGLISLDDSEVSGSLKIFKSGSTILEVRGSEGQMLEIADRVTGSLFAVNTLSGTPIFEVFSDDTVKIGEFENEAIIISGSEIIKLGAFTNITASGNISASGNIYADEFHGDGSNLTGITFTSPFTATGITGSFNEASASFSTRVTANDAKLTANTANVTTAGALMDSEVTSLSLIKELTSTAISGAFDAVSASLASDIPTNNNQLTNGANYITETTVSDNSTNASFPIVFHSSNDLLTDPGNPFVINPSSEVISIQGGATLQINNSSLKFAGTSKITTDVTASNNISASGNIIASGAFFSGIRGPLTQSYVLFYGDEANGEITYGDAGGFGEVTAINNGTENNLVTIGNPNTELDGEPNLTFDGSTLDVTGNITATSTISGSELAAPENIRLTGANSQKRGVVMRVGGSTYRHLVSAESFNGDLRATLGNHTTDTQIDCNNKLYVEGAISSSGEIIMKNYDVLSVDAGSNYLDVGLDADFDLIRYGKNGSPIHQFAGKTRIDTREFRKTTTTDGDHEGDIVYFGNTTSMDTGKIYYFTNGGGWIKADADSSSTSIGLLGVALGSNSNDDGVLLRGMVTLDHDPGTIGDVLFLNNSTAGTATSNSPTTTGHIVRIIGYCIDSSNGQIWFNPSPDYIIYTA